MTTLIWVKLTDFDVGSDQLKLEQRLGNGLNVLIRNELQIVHGGGNIAVP
jgi:hypothetical protein